MQWTKITSDDELAFELTVSDKITSRILFDKNQSYYETQCEINGEKYSIEREGFWKNRILLKDENGNEIASIKQKRLNARRWTLMVDGKEYLIHYHNNPLYEMVVYEERRFFLLTYKLKTRHAETHVDVAFHEAIQKLPGKWIIATLAWYLFIPVAQESVVSYAVH